MTTTKMEVSRSTQIQTWAQAQDWKKIGTFAALAVVVWPIQYTMVMAAAVTGAMVLPFMLLFAAVGARRTVKNNKGLIAGALGLYVHDKRTQARHDEHMQLLRAQQGIAEPEVPAVEEAPQKSLVGKMVLPWGLDLVRTKEAA